jgi:hypothetical protein
VLKLRGIRPSNRRERRDIPDSSRRFYFFDYAASAGINRAQGEYM